MMLGDLKKDLRFLANFEKANLSQKFFKTGIGEYGEGDIFLGIIVPNTRMVARKYTNLSLTDIKKLLYSKIHEERLCALLILVEKFARANSLEQKHIYTFYLGNANRVNNWDLVDVSAHKIVGEYLLNRNRNILVKLAKSKNLWKKRISIISTLTFIKNNQYDDTLRLANILIKDKHDLIHKAVGWALREVGKKSMKDEEIFLKKHYKSMSRTMLRYSIEKFPEEKRIKYLKGSI